MLRASRLCPGLARASQLGTFGGHINAFGITYTRDAPLRRGRRKAGFALSSCASGVDHRGGNSVNYQTFTAIALASSFQTPAGIEASCDPRAANTQSIARDPAAYLEFGEASAGPDSLEPKASGTARPSQS